jgi:predicted transcriptional regulator of viral defense system
MQQPPLSQRERVVAALSRDGMTRMAELLRAGVTAATISRLERSGVILRLSRGLYQLPDAAIDAHHSLAEASKLVPRGVVCLGSALAFHDLTDHIPSKVWMAIGRKDWRPRITHPPMRFVRFSADALTSGIEIHRVEGVILHVTDPTRTILDMFRYRRTVGQAVALAGLKEMLRRGMATANDIERGATRMGVGRLVTPYLEALSADA